MNRSVSHYSGLFYFDSSFRPIPLEQHFIGVRGKPGSLQSRKNLDRVTYQKVANLVAQGHQVMVFVHTRKDTVKSALDLKDSAHAEGTIDDFTCQQHPQWTMFRRRIGESRNKEMKELFDYGFGIHHAGMLRSDRNMMESMFEARAIKVMASLCRLVLFTNFLGLMLHGHFGLGCKLTRSCW
jgi:antiviral helicase SLH1